MSDCFLEQLEKDVFRSNFYFGWIMLWWWNKWHSDIFLRRPNTSVQRVLYWTWPRKSENMRGQLYEPIWKLYRPELRARRTVVRIRLKEVTHQITLWLIIQTTFQNVKAARESFSYVVQVRKFIIRNTIQYPFTPYFKRKWGLIDETYAHGLNFVTIR